MACKLIVFEGLDNCGKDTQINKLKYRLQSTGIPAKAIDSVTDTNIGYMLRHKTFDELADPRQLIALFIADFYNKIKEIKYTMSMSDTTLILCNRWYYSTLAYCGDISLIPAIKTMCNTEFVPDVTYLIDISPEIAIERNKNSSKRKDRYSKLDTLRAAHRIYDAMATDEKNDITVLDGTDSITMLHNEIVADLTSRDIIKRKLKKNDRW